MNLSELENQVIIMLRHFHVNFKTMHISRGISTSLVVEDFGLVICCINRLDYTQVSNTVMDQFKDFRVVYLTTNDEDMQENKYRVLWALMRGGYMKWLRYTFPRQIQNLLNGSDNLGHRIIKERLRIWGNKPKYKFLVEDNNSVLKNGILRELSNDPGFFDYMPEEE